MEHGQDQRGETGEPSYAPGVSRVPLMGLTIGDLLPRTARVHGEEVRAWIVPREGATAEAAAT